MSNLALPSSVVVRVLTLAEPVHAPRDVLLTSPPLAVVVQTFARTKNDYHLGPFVSDNGIVRISRADLELAAAAELDLSLMDYRALVECFAFVEIRPLSAAQVARAIDARRTEVKKARFYSMRDAERWGSPADYVRRLKECANLNLKEPLWCRVRDEWDGSRSTVEYDLRVPSATTG